MDISLSETQSLLQATIRSYLKDNVASATTRELEATAAFDSKAWEYLRQSGFVDIAVPVSKAGAGGSLTELGTVVEECARRPLTVPILEAAVCVVVASRFGSGPAADAIVEAVRSGAMTIAPSILEKSDRFDDVLCEVRNSTITGQKRFVDYGESVSHHLVAAMQDDAPGLFLVATDSAAVAFERLRTIAGTPQAHVSYANARAERVAGSDGYRFLIQLARALAAVQCLGAAQRAFEMTVDYVGVRAQFGRPIGSFQAVQHHVANMATMVTACRFLVYEALWKLDTNALESTEIEVAKAWASKTATEVPMMAHQLHGGIGVTLEYDLQLLSRRGKERAVSWGTTNECLSAIGTRLATAGAV